MLLPLSLAFSRKGLWERSSPHFVKVLFLFSSTWNSRQVSLLSLRSLPGWNDPLHIAPCRQKKEIPVTPQLPVTYHCTSPYSCLYPQVTLTPLSTCEFLQAQQTSVSVSLTCYVPTANVLYVRGAHSVFDQHPSSQRCLIDLSVLFDYHVRPATIHSQGQPSSFFST